MQIHIGSGTGTGPTTLAAFDAALYDAGIANYNLLVLSSVIPPETDIILHDKTITQEMPGNWGDRLYVVMAEQRVDQPGQEAWAGIGWVQDPETGKGLFVEHEGFSEASVRDDITNSLQALLKTRGITNFGPIQMKVNGTVCTGAPACAMVVAAYQSSNWHNEPSFFKEK